MMKTNAPEKLWLTPRSTMLVTAWTFTAVWANATDIEAKVSSQNADVRSVSRSVNDASSTGAGAPPRDGDSAASGDSPSGSSPKSSGRRRMNSQPGTTMSANVKTARAAYA